MKFIESLKNFFKLCKISNIGEFDDGYHSFNSLYYQRAILFATIVKANKDKSWKTRKHEDGSLCFGGGWFLVTVETPKGDYGYHFSDDYWHYFECKEIEKAKHWDGYTDTTVDRLLFLNEYDNLKGEKFMNFGEALNEVKNGKKAKRSGWNGKDQFIELATNVSFVRPNGEVVNVNHKDRGNIAIAFHGPSGIQLGWLASRADMLAEDWEVID